MNNLGLTARAEALGVLGRSLGSDDTPLKGSSQRTLVTVLHGQRRFDDQDAAQIAPTSNV